MSDNIATHPELEALDELISKLEAIIVESDESPLIITPQDSAKKAQYRAIGNAAAAGHKKMQPCEAVYLDETKLVLRCPKTEIVRLTPLEVTVNAEKSGRGEAFAVITGKASGIKRVRGGYEVEVEVEEKKKFRISASQRLREYLAKSDTAGWNRWCQDVRDGLDLMNMDLRRADLQGCDLCCANLAESDLTGANLTGATLAGADLTNCKLDDATVIGVDFFRARMKRSQSALLALSGLMEVESVIFDN